MEGMIKNIKQQPDSSMDCDELALYFDARWKDFRASHQTSVSNLEKMNNIIAKRKEKTHANHSGEKGTSIDNIDGQTIS